MNSSRNRARAHAVIALGLLLAAGCAHAPRDRSGPRRSLAPPRSRPARTHRRKPPPPRWWSPTLRSPTVRIRYHGGPRRPPPPRGWIRPRRSLPRSWRRFPTRCPVRLRLPAPVNRYHPRRRPQRARRREKGATPRAGGKRALRRPRRRSGACRYSRPKTGRRPRASPGGPRPPSGARPSSLPSRRYTRCGWGASPRRRRRRRSATGPCAPATRARSASGSAPGGRRVPMVARSGRLAPMPTQSDTPLANDEPELRRDPIAGRWVILAPERGAAPPGRSRPRPSPAASRAPSVRGTTHTPPEVLAVRAAGTSPNGPGWTRAVPEQVRRPHAGGRAEEVRRRSTSGWTGSATTR